MSDMIIRFGGHKRTQYSVDNDQADHCIRLVVKEFEELFPDKNIEFEITMVGREVRHCKNCIRIEEGYREAQRSEEQPTSKKSLFGQDNACGVEMRTKVVVYAYPCCIKERLLELVDNDLVVHDLEIRTWGNRRVHSDKCDTRMMTEQAAEDKAVDDSWYENPPLGVGMTKQMTWADKTLDKKRKPKLLPLYPEEVAAQVDWMESRFEERTTYHVSKVRKTTDNEIVDLETIRYSIRTIDLDVDPEWPVATGSNHTRTMAMIIDQPSDPITSGFWEGSCFVFRWEQRPLTYPDFLAGCKFKRSVQASNKLFWNGTTLNTPLIATEFQVKMKPLRCSSL